MTRDLTAYRKDALADEQADLLQALNGLSASSTLAVAQRTRRTIRETAIELRDNKKRRRRSHGTILLAAIALLTLLTPAIWSGVDEFFAGEHLSDLSTMVTLLAVTLFSAVVAALIASWRNHQHLRYERRNF